MKNFKPAHEKNKRPRGESRLARHKVPKYIEFTDAFPMNAAGKVLKYKMREDAIQRLGLNVK
jgi:fatty-acyl-CoA synthase